MAKKQLACQFPGCNTVAHKSSAMDSHHIVPRSMGGSDMPFNLMTLCPGCHRKIHVPHIRGGIHAEQQMGGIVVLGYMHTSGGKALHYRMLENGFEFVWIYRTRENILLEEPIAK